MKYIALLLTLTLSLALGASTAAQAQIHGSFAPCTVATPADLAAARLSPVAATGMGPMTCFLMWSRSQHTGMSVSVAAARHARSRSGTGRNRYGHMRKSA